MKKKLIHGLSHDLGMVHKIWLTMRLIVILFFVSLVHVSASVYSQKTKLSIKVENATLQQVFDLIQDQSEFDFFYKNEQIPENARVSVDVYNETIETILNNVLKGTGLKYGLVDKDIVISPNERKEFQQPQFSISGKVTDVSGATIPGVSVSVKGTTIGTITDGEGNFTLQVTTKANIVSFSFVGMKTQEVTFDEKNTKFVIIMEEIAIGVNEVIVVGYGTQKKSDITGTVASVSKERLEMIPNLNIAQAIQGAIPGVMVQTTSAGAAPSQDIMIRGRNSILANNSPLVIVDGIPYSGSVNDINASDVKSIEILKDASAAAIYGSRGSNGVILVTTKEGSEGKAKVSYDGRYSIQSYTKLPDMMDGAEFYDFKQLRDPSSMTQSEIDVYNSGKWVNWLDLAMRKGKSQQHNVAVSGSTKNTKFYISTNWLDIKGLMEKDDFKRLTNRINLEIEITNWLKIGTRTLFTIDDKSGAEPSMEDLFYTNPLATAYNENGNLTIVPIPDDPTRINPLETMLYDDKNKSYQILNNNFAIVEIPFIPGLSYRINTGISYLFSDKGTYIGRDTHTGLNVGGESSTSKDISKSIIIENIISYNKTIGKHKIFATALYSNEVNEYSSNELSASGFPNDFLGWYSAAQADLVTPAYDYNKTVLISQMLRLNYDYESRYLVTLTGRRDGYSGFGANSKWGYFPSLALGWNLRSEKLFPWKNLFNELKIRASYGLNGNQAVGAYQTISRLSEENLVSGTASLPGYSPSKLGSDNLGWESSKTLNIGLDFDVLKSRISGAFNLYSTNTTDLLLNRSISAVHGITTITQNIGATKNEGIEFSINSRNIIKKDFSWNTSGNISFVRNEIVSLYGNLNAEGEEIDDINNQWFIGHPIQVNYDYIFNGVWQSNEAAEAAKWGSLPGYIKIKDVNNDSKLTAEDRQIIGQKDPKMIWGLTNTIKYKNFTLDIFVHGVQGVTRNNELMMDTGVSAGVRKNTITKNWWTPENPSNDFYRNNINAHLMSGVTAGIYESADFVRIKDISLAYDLSSKLMTRFGLNKLRLYVTGRNLFTFTNWRGLDPELIGTELIPLQKEFVFGMNIGF